MKRPRLLWLLAVVVLLVSVFAAYEAWMHAPALKIPGVTAARPAAVSTAGGMDAGLDEADKDILVQLRQSSLWIAPLGGKLRDTTTQKTVQDCVDMTLQERHTLDGAVGTTAAALGVTLPSTTSPDRANLLPVGDKDTLNAMRREQGDLLKAVVADRVVTDNEQVRDLDNQATLALERAVGFAEATGLVDYATLAPPAVTAEAVVSIDPITLDAAIVVLVIVGVLSAIFIRLLLRRQRKGSA